MPTIARFAACTVSIYPADHNPPHVHIRGPDFEALVEIGGSKSAGRAGSSAGRARSAPSRTPWIGSRPTPKCSWSAGRS
ncbi:DUF4160 domain-containing protein [Azospirillum sp.]|uniref:DUF4160 domain-containing protein n=1 Tax=Azospirillum sp. TaxID=34012 RepID=UPI0039C873C1